MSSFTIGVVKTFDNDPIYKIDGSYSYWLAPDPTSTDQQTLRMLYPPDIDSNLQISPGFFQRINTRHVESWTYRPPVPASSSQFWKTRINQFGIRKHSPTDRYVRCESTHGNTLHPPNSWVTVYIANTNRTSDLGRKEPRAEFKSSTSSQYGPPALCTSTSLDHSATPSGRAGYSPGVSLSPLER